MFKYNIVNITVKKNIWHLFTGFKYLIWFYKRHEMSYLIKKYNFLLERFKL